MRGQRGFTLIELMVALFITAVLFAIGYQALQQSLVSRKDIDAQALRLQTIQQTLRILEQDFELLAPRPVRAPIGDGYLPAILSSQSTGGLESETGDAGSTTPVPVVTFTRGGWSNPAGVQRSELQRVTYVITNHTLVRTYLPVLDATQAVNPVQRVLLDHVKRFTVRYLDTTHQWQPQWPPTAIGGSATGASVALSPQLWWRPIAVEISLELDDWGLIVRHIEVAG